MELQNIKNQSETKNTLLRINSGVDEAEDKIRDLENKEAENTSNQDRVKKKE